MHWRISLASSQLNGEKDANVSVGSVLDSTIHYLVPLSLSLSFSIRPIDWEKFREVCTWSAAAAAAAATTQTRTTH